MVVSWSSGSGSDSPTPRRFRTTTWAYEASRSYSAAASGAPVRAIVERLGHSSASFSLDRYAHLLPSLGAEAATRIETLVDGEGRG